MVGSELRRTLATDRKQYVVLIAEAVAYTSEETYELIIALVAAHTSLSILQVLTYTEVVVLEEVVQEVGVVSIEALVHRILIAVTYKCLKAVVAPLVLIGRGNLQVISLAIAVAVCSITSGVRVLLAIVLRSIVSCIVTVIALGREHQVCLPSADRFNGYVACKTCAFSLPFTFLLFQNTDGVIVVINTKVLVIVAVLAIDWFGRVTHQSLTVYHLACCIYRAVLVPVFQDVELHLEHVVEHPVADATIEAHILTIGVNEHTLLIAIGKVCIIRSTLVATIDADIMIVSKSCA